LAQDKNGENNKIICMCLLLNQNTRTVPKASRMIMIFDERSPSNNVEAVKDLVGDNPGPLAELWNLDKG
jgi:hypothetical protein